MKDAALGDGGWYLDVRPLRNIKVLRHPIVALLSERRRIELQKLANEYCTGLTGTAYARYERLLPLVRYPAVKRILNRWSKGAKNFAKALDRAHGVFRADRGLRGLLAWEWILCGYKGTSSYFCSEIIVNIHEALGLDMARNDMSASSFTPDDLYDETQSLLGVVDIVLRMSPAAPQKRRNRKVNQLEAESEHLLASASKESIQV